MLDHTKKRVAAYARYSSDKQRPVSIEDQVRRCREVAMSRGLEIDENLIFVDRARTGKTHKVERKGFNALMQAWDAGEVDIVLADELSRMFRNPAQKVELQCLIEETGVHLITGNGVDTTQPNWQLAYSLQGMVNEQSTRDTRYRVIRGMVGQLERGYMIATPVYGYQYERVYDENGNRIGTQWVIDEDEAKIVNEIFERRQKGASYRSIAKILNDRRVTPPRPNKETGEGHWRIGAIDRLLKNPIYKGIFVWHGSSELLKKMKRRKQDPETQEFPRPQLRIVEDEIWEACNNKKTVSRTGYGGGKHVFSGVVACGICGASCSVSTGGGAPSLHCAQCEQARGVGVKVKRTGYLSIRGLEEVLNFAVTTLFSEPMVIEFRDRLRGTLTKDVKDDLVQLRIERDRLTRQCERMANTICKLDENDEFLLKEYQSVKKELELVRKKIAELKERAPVIDKEALEKQMEIDPAEKFKRIWNSNMPKERVRALLSNLFEEIVLEGKPQRNVAIIRVTAAPGVMAAVLSDTMTIDQEAITMRFRLTSGNRRPSVWKVEQLFD